jgi:hypothetical protein
MPENLKQKDLDVREESYKNTSKQHTLCISVYNDVHNGSVGNLVDCFTVNRFQSDSDEGVVIQL